MALKISKTEAGHIKYGDDASPEYYANPTNVSIKTNAATNSMTIAWGNVTRTFAFEDLEEINGVQTPTDINEAAVLLLDSVFRKPVANGAPTGITLKTPNEPFGMAAMGTGTTGGAGGTVLVSADPAVIAPYLDNDTPKILYISESIVNDYIENGFLQIGSNTTLIGLPGVKLTNVGMKINDSSNIIIRNITSEKVLQGTVDNDCISIRNSHHIWIDHCDLSGSLDYRSLDYELYDGLIDITDKSDFITVSYCSLHDSWKAMLIGNSDRWLENVGKLNITIAFCNYKRCHERSPLLVTGKVHFMNNYLVDCGSSEASGGAVTLMHDGTVRTDNNYFHDVRNPIATQYGEELDGYIANSASNIKIGIEGGGYYITTPESTWDPKDTHYQYADLLRSAKDVPSYVLEHVGAILPDLR